MTPVELAGAAVAALATGHPEPAVILVVPGWASRRAQRIRMPGGRGAPLGEILNEHEKDGRPFTTARFLAHDVLGWLVHRCGVVSLRTEHAEGGLRVVVEEVA